MAISIISGKSNSFLYLLLIIVGFYLRKAAFKRDELGGLDRVCCNGCLLPHLPTIQWLCDQHDLLLVGGGHPVHRLHRWNVCQFVLYRVYLPLLTVWSLREPLGLWAIYPVCFRLQQLPALVMSYRAMLNCGRLCTTSRANARSN